MKIKNHFTPTNYEKLLACYYCTCLGGIVRWVDGILFCKNAERRTKEMRNILLLLLISVSVSAQPKRYEEKLKQDTLNQELWTKYSNALTVFTNDRNWGLGVSYDHRWQRLGFYARYSQGDYYTPNEYAVEMEYKLAAGILIGTPHEEDKDWWPYLSIGVNYNWYKYEEVSYAPFYLKGHNKFTQPWSFDFGMTAQLWRFSQMVTWDPIFKKQLLFGVGGMWNFNKR